MILAVRFEPWWLMFKGKETDKTSAFMVARAMLGFGNSLAQICSPMLLTELAHPQHRARLTAIYNCLWNVGAFGKSSSRSDIFN